MRTKALPGLLAICLPAIVWAQQTSPILGNERCQALSREGQALKVDNKYNEALAKYREAASADPKASMPLSLMAGLFLEASGLTDPKNVESYRNQAKALAQEALGRQADDPMALEVLRGLSGETRESVGSSSTEARKAYDEAESWYGKGQYPEALERYLAAFAKDPTFAKAVLYAGDCHFALKAFAKAEACYLKATELDPNDAQAWRFLADAQVSLQRPLGEVKANLLKAIAAQPNYLPAWARYEEVRKMEGTPLKVFRPEVRAGLVKDPKTGKATIQLAELKQDDGSLDSPLWLAYGVSLVAAETDVSKGEAPRSPFQAQLYAWEKTLAIAQELAPEKKPIKDPTLNQFKAFGEAKHLETAILLFLYRESFRPDLEAWKKKNPKAIASFLEVFSLRPPAK